MNCEFCNLLLSTLLRAKQSFCDKKEKKIHFDHLIIKKFNLKQIYKSQWSKRHIIYLNRTRLQSFWGKKEKKIHFDYLIIKKFNLKQIYKFQWSKLHINYLNRTRLQDINIWMLTCILAIKIEHVWLWLINYDRFSNNIILLIICHYLILEEGCTCMYRILLVDK